MKVRNLQKGDLEKLSYLYEQFWHDRSDVEKMERQFDIVKDDKDYIFLAAEQDGAVVGSVMGVVCKELYGECRPFLVVEDMIVDKPFRRSGAGRALLSELEARARALDCTQMILVTEMGRTDACAFYENYGFSKNNKGYKKKI